MSLTKQETESKIRECEKFYIDFYSTADDNPKQLDLTANGFTREFIRQHWGGKLALDANMAELLAAKRIPKPKRKFKRKMRTDIFIITGVQNNTRVNKRFMKCLERYADYLGRTQIIGMPIYYKNPTSADERKSLEKKYWWDGAFTGEFLTDRFELSDNIVLMGQHRIQATSSKPLSGLENLSGNASAVYAHSQCGMHPVANAACEISKQLWTTSSCCHASNYSNTNAGGKAEFHHVTGAIIIEMYDGVPYVNQINYDGKGFYHFDCYVTPRTVKNRQRVAGLDMGDIHSEVADRAVIEKTFIGDDSLMALLNPEKVIVEDLLDFIGQGHHNRKNVFLKYLLAKNEKDSVQYGIDSCSAILDLIDDRKTEIWIADSNHHDHLTRWLNETDWRSLGPKNAQFYIALVNEMLNRIHLTPELGIGGPSAFEIALRKVTNKKLKFMDPNEKNMIGSIDVGHHGDKGPNGTKGSIMGFARTGAKLVIGHSHTPGIYLNVFQTGKKCVMIQNYNKGLSSHLHTDVIIYANGKRSLVTFINGHFRGRR